MARRTRVGFTLVELLVVITIIGMLMSMLLPAVNSVREAARRTQCAVNMDQIALAMQNYVTSKGYFPGYRGNKVPDTNGNQVDNSDVSWFVAAAPQMEQSVIYDQWERFVYTVPPAAGKANFPLIPVAICPSDPAEQTTPANNLPVSFLSYVVNAGRQDPNASNVNQNEIPDQGANGIFHDRRYVRAPRVGLEMKDGAGNTILLSENVQATWWSRQNEPDVAFYFQHLPNSLVQVTGNNNKRFLEPKNPTHKINGNRTAAVSGHVDSGRPSSSHPGGVMVVFADRHSTFLREDIDYDVFQQLMTPDGYNAACEVPAQNKLYVLSAGDYADR